MKHLDLSRAKGLPRVQSVQNEFSLLDRSDDPYVAEVCVREDVGYLPYSPLAMGLMSGKYANGNIPEGSRWAVENGIGSRHDRFRSTPESHAAVDEYIAAAKKHGLDVCQMALKYVDLQAFVTSTIIGATTMEQLKTNIDAFDLDLSAAALADINAVYRRYPLPF